MNRKDRVYIADWLEFKPYKTESPVDIAYLEVCNDVKKALVTNKQSLVLQAYLDNAGINDLACFLTAYLEDLVSDTNIWNTFIRVHKRLYKKQLPFYELEEYFEEEINLQDLCFLIWYYISTQNEDTLIAPYHDFIFEAAEKVMDVFDDFWEYAPENLRLKAYYSLDEEEEDFYKARILMENLLFKSYLFFPDTGDRLLESELRLIEETGQGEEEVVLHYLQENHDAAVHSFRTKLLALSGKEWAKEILGEDHPLAESFVQMSPKVMGVFQCKGQNEEDFELEHIASGKQFRLTKKSFEWTLNLDDLVWLGIVKWREEWWFSGVSIPMPFSSDLVRQEKQSPVSLGSVAFLDNENGEMEEILLEQREHFIAFNNGSEIAFMPGEEINTFLNSFYDHYNESLGLQKEQTEVKERTKRDGSFGKDQEKEMNTFSGDGLVFCNPKGGFEMYTELNSAFPVPNNPYFEESESDQAVLEVLLSPQCSLEIAQFCIEKGRDKIPFFHNSPGESLLMHSDFLLRFWKKDNYHTPARAVFMDSKTQKN